MRWEYKVIKLTSLKGLGDSKELQNELNDYGNSGWELVGVLTKPNEGVGWIPREDEGSVMFKRAVKMA